MKRQAVYTVGISLLAVTAAPQFVYAQTKTQNVNVVNSVVPVQVNNAVVPVEVSNADPIAIEVSNTLPVAVSSQETLDTRNIVRLSWGGRPTQGVCGANQPSYIVPDGKVLIVEYVSFSGPSENAVSSFAVRLAGMTVRFPPPAARYPVLSDNLYVSEQITMYGFPGDHLSLHVFGSNFQASGDNYQCFLMGRLVDET